MRGGADARGRERVNRSRDTHTTDRPILNINHHNSDSRQSDSQPGGWQHHGDDR